MFAFNILLLIVIGYCSFGAHAQDYCNPELCHLWNGAEYVQQPNIACNNDGDLSPACPAGTELVDITNYIDLIITLHNMGRNNVSLGDIEGMDTAAKMYTMTWNDNLKYMAELNCKRCLYSHDKCRNTPEFPHSGQNIGIVRTSGNKTATQVITQIFDDWFKEHFDASMGTISNFTGSNGGPSIGHYTQVVQQNAYQVGCGLIVWYAEHNGKNEQNSYFVCNYAVGNIIGSPIYTSGATATGCTSGTDGNFIGLCAPDEPIDSTELAN